MTAFFTYPRALALQADAASWVGTPFHDHSQIKGAGVDCVHLALALYQSAGFIGPMEFPAYSMSEGQHAHESKVLKLLDGNPNFLRLQSYSSGIHRMPGDLLCFKVSRTGVEHHVGVFLGGLRCEFINSMQRYGVRILSISQWEKMLTAAYRPIEL